MLKKLLQRPLWLLLSGLVIVAIIPALILVHPGKGVFASGGGPGPGPSLEVGPNPSNPGGTISVTGFNYPVNVRVQVYFQKRTNGVINAITDSGGFFNAQLTLPKTYIKGTKYYVYAISTTFSASVLFSFTKPSISIGNYYGSLSYGSSNQVYGSGFAVNEAVKLTLSYGTKTSTLATIATDSNGQLFYQFIVPSIPAGIHATLTATGAISGVTASIPFVENAGVISTPSQGPVGTQVKLVGGGFGDKETVKATFQGKLVASLQTDATGALSLQFAVPQSASLNNSYNDIQIIGTKSGAAASTSFQVLPLLSLVPNRGAAGTLIAVNGSHFSPNGYIFLELVDPTGGSSGGGIFLSQFNASAAGAFHTSFVVPFGLITGKTYDVSATDTFTGATVMVKFHAL